MFMLYDMKYTYVETKRINNVCCRRQRSNRRFFSSSSFISLVFFFLNDDGRDSVECMQQPSRYRSYLNKYARMIARYRRVRFLGELMFHARVERSKFNVICWIGTIDVMCRLLSVDGWRHCLPAFLERVNVLIMTQNFNL